MEGSITQLKRRDISILKASLKCGQTPVGPLLVSNLGHSPVSASKAFISQTSGHGDLRIAAGSDMFGTGDVSRAWEIELKAEIMGPMASIISATRTNAQLLGMQDHLGTIEAGKIADMIAVEGNPLDDVSLLKDANNVEMVVQTGRVVKGSNGALKLRWERLA